MGPEKGRNLTQALLTRNLRSWHNFVEIEGIGEVRDDMETYQDEQKQNMLERRGSCFPWSAPNHSSEHTAATTNASGAAKNRRRRQSLQRLTFSDSTTMEAAVKELHDEEISSVLTTKPLHNFHHT
jgi:hypothetical protein